MDARATPTVESPDALEASLGLTPQTARLIGAITIFAANAEFRLERAIWRLQSYAPPGVRPPTDGQPAATLIDMLEDEGRARLHGPELEVVELWCVTARLAFDFRNSIAHGVALRHGQDMLIARNRSFEGEVRKRPGRSLWGDRETLENIRGTLAVLLSIISRLSNHKYPMPNIAKPERLEALKRSKALMDEMSLTSGPWYEGHE